MHIPDGFLDAKIAVTTGVLGAAGIGAALWHARRTLPARKVPLLGVAAAFIFAAQMLNFPVAGGTSGHLVGAVLAGALLGPSAGVVALTAVLVVQCLMFADGGITALGANVFNMALVGVLSGYGVYTVTRRALPGVRGIVLGAAFAGWCSTVVASISCAAQLSWSGTVAWAAAFPAMAGIHMLIGIGEGLITALVVVAIARVRPELLEPAKAPVAWGRVLRWGGATTLGLALLASPFASDWPDGLEKVAAALGFEHHAAGTPVLPAPLPDYEIPSLESWPWTTAVVGLVGTVVAFGLAWMLMRVLVKDGPDAA